MAEGAPVDLDRGKVEAAGWGGAKNEREMVAGSGGIPRMEGGYRLARLVGEDPEEGGDWVAAQGGE